MTEWKIIIESVLFLPQLSKLFSGITTPSSQRRNCKKFHLNSLSKHAAAWCHDSPGGLDQGAIQPRLPFMRDHQQLLGSRRIIPSLCCRPAVRALLWLKTASDPQDWKVTKRLNPQWICPVSFWTSSWFPEILNAFGLQVFSCLGSNWKANMGQNQSGKAHYFPQFWFQMRIETRFDSQMGKLKV